MKPWMVITAGALVLAIALAAVVGKVFLEPAEQRAATVDAAVGGSGEAGGSASGSISVSPGGASDDFERGEQITDQRADQVQETKKTTRVIIDAVNTAGE